MLALNHIPAYAANMGTGQIFGLEAHGFDHRGTLQTATETFEQTGVEVFNLLEFEGDDNALAEALTLHRGYYAILATSGLGNAGRRLPYRTFPIIKTVHIFRDTGGDAVYIRDEIGDQRYYTNDSVKDLGATLLKEVHPCLLHSAPRVRSGRQAA